MQNASEMPLWRRWEVCFRFEILIADLTRVVILLANLPLPVAGEQYNPGLTPGRSANTRKTRQRMQQSIRSQYEQFAEMSNMRF